MLAAGDELATAANSSLGTQLKFENISPYGLLSLFSLLVICTQARVLTLYTTAI